MALLGSGRAAPRPPGLRPLRALRRTGARFLPINAEGGSPVFGICFIEKTGSCEARRGCGGVPPACRLWVVNPFIAGGRSGCSRLRLCPPSTGNRVVHAQPGYLAQKSCLEMHKSKRFLWNRKKARFFKRSWLISRCFGSVKFDTAQCQI